MRRRVAILVVLGLAAVIAAYLAETIKRGFSARDAPSRLEVVLAGFMRSMSVPAGARSKVNPLRPTAATLAEGRAHFADHCALCHANDGSGQTAIGQNLYPKAPDMRLTATQGKSDGELYYIIHNGIRLTGMPAWGGAGEDADNWALALFIHHLPQLSPAERLEMERLNPKTEAELEEEKAEDEFLRGGTSAPATPRKEDHQ